MQDRLASKYQTLFTAASSSSTSWLITIRPPRWPLRKSRSQPIESASRWLVGSSSSSVLGSPAESANRIRASSMRRRWPPDRVPSGWPSTRSGSPRCEQIRAASASAAYPPSAAKRSSSWPYRRTSASFSCSSASRMADRGQLAQDAVQAAGGQHPVCQRSGPGRRCADPAAGSRLPRCAGRSRRAAASRRPAPSAWWSCRHRSGRPGRSGRRAGPGAWWGRAGCGRPRAVRDQWRQSWWAFGSRAVVGRRRQCERAISPGRCPCDPGYRTCQA